MPRVHELSMRRVLGLVGGPTEGQVWKRRPPECEFRLAKRTRSKHQAWGGGSQLERIPASSRAHEARLRVEKKQRVTKAGTVESRNNTRSALEAHLEIRAL